MRKIAFLFYEQMKRDAVGEQRELPPGWEPYEKERALPRIRVCPVCGQEGGDWEYETDEYDPIGRRNKVEYIHAECVPQFQESVAGDLQFLDLIPEAPKSEKPAPKPNLMPVVEKGLSEIYKSAPSLEKKTQTQFPKQKSLNLPSSDEELDRLREQVKRDKEKIEKSDEGRKGLPGRVKLPTEKDWEYHQKSQEQEKPPEDEWWIGEEKKEEEPVSWWSRMKKKLL